MSPMPSNLRSTRVSRGIAGSGILFLALTGSCNVHGSTAPDLPSEFPGHVLIVSGMGRTDTATVKLDFPFVINLAGASPTSAAGLSVRFISLVVNQSVDEPFLLLAVFGTSFGSANFSSGVFDVA